MADALASRWHLPRWSPSRHALTTIGRIEAGPVYLMKPQTWMNNSGAALRGLRAATPDDQLGDLLVLVDDLALDVGTFRLRRSGSDGGHNGLKSIEAEVGTRNYPRLRIGIGPRPADADQVDFVIGATPPDVRHAIVELLPTMAEAVECWAAEGIERAMARYNHRKPAEP